MQPPKSLSDFQAAYSRHLRQPQPCTLPIKVPAERSKVYERLLFNNIRGFIDRCFPVARNIIGEREWSAVCRKFYQQWHCTTPIFSQIPREFCEHISRQDKAEYPWLADLLHYEWLELEVDLSEAHVGEPCPLEHEDDMVQVNPTLKVQHYQWPVHKLSPSFISEEPVSTILCVYRRYDMDVHFMEINAVTAELLRVIEQQQGTPAEALSRLCVKLPNIKTDHVHTFGNAIISQLLESNVLLVAHPSSRRHGRRC